MCPGPARQSPATRTRRSTPGGRQPTADLSFAIPIQALDRVNDERTAFEHSSSVLSAVAQTEVAPVSGAWRLRSTTDASRPAPAVASPPACRRAQNAARKNSHRLKWPGHSRSPARRRRASCSVFALSVDNTTEGTESSQRRFPLVFSVICPGKCLSRRQPQRPKRPQRRRNPSRWPEGRRGRTPPAPEAHRCRHVARARERIRRRITGSARTRARATARPSPVSSRASRYRRGHVVCPGDKQLGVIADSADGRISRPGCSRAWNSVLARSTASSIMKTQSRPL